MSSENHYVQFEKIETKVELLSELILLFRGYKERIKMYKSDEEEAFLVTSNFKNVETVDDK